MKSRYEMEDELCNFCPLDRQGVYSVPDGFAAGCEGSRCDDAYDAYVDYCQDNEKPIDSDSSTLESKINELKNEQSK